MSCCSDESPDVVGTIVVVTENVNDTGMLDPSMCSKADETGLYHESKEQMTNFLKAVPGL